MNYDYIDSVVLKLLERSRIPKSNVNIGMICKSENIRLFSFSDSEKILKLFGLEDHTVGNAAFCIGNAIFFDNTLSPTLRRFAIAHELGHVLLHNNVENPSEEHEREADAFAKRLLYYLAY